MEEARERGESDRLYVRPPRLSDMTDEELREWCRSVVEEFNRQIGLGDSDARGAERDDG